MSRLESFRLCAALAMGVVVLASASTVRAQFDPLGECKVIGKAKLFCVPTHKNVSSFEVEKQPATPLDVVGPEPVPDRICY